MKPIYLDYASTTSVDPDVLKAMVPYFSDNFGNPSSIHSFGQDAQRAVDDARQKIAGFLGCLSQEIIFTGSATEANNMAIRGIVGYIRKQRPKDSLHIIVSSIEHESVLAPARRLERDYGVPVTYLPVNRDGFVDPDALRGALTENTVLVSVIYANNEVGTIQPIAEISDIIKKHNEDIKAKSYKLKAMFHTDAAQAANYLDMNVNNLGVDALTISGHKIYGPKGAGALYLKKGTLIDPLIVGAAQEYGKRAGTENVPYIVGLGAAVERVSELRGKTAELKNLRDYFIKEIEKNIPRASVNGATDNRLPNNTNIRFDGVNSADLLLLLDQDGIAVSAGSACESKAQADSHVLKALGLSAVQARSSVRFSLGRPTTKEDVDYAIEVLVKLVKRLRK